MSVNRYVGPSVGRSVSATRLCLPSATPSSSLLVPVALRVESNSGRESCNHVLAVYRKSSAAATATEKLQTANCQLQLQRPNSAEGERKREREHERDM